MKRVLFLAALLPLSAAFAQETPSRDGAPELTEAQREHIRALVLARRAQAEPLFTAFAAARRAKLEAMVTMPPNEGRIRHAAAAFGKADADMSVFIAKLYNEVLPMLTEEQRGWLEQNREILVRFLELQIQMGLRRLEQRGQGK